MASAEDTIDLSDRGGTLQISRWGDGAPSIVMLHDGLGSVAQWRDVPAAIGARTGRGVLAYDRAGHGRSTPVPSGPWPYRWHVDEAHVLERIMQHFDMPERIVVGHSDGGTIAFEHALLGYEQDCLVAVASHTFLEEISLATCRALVAHPEPVIAGLARAHAEPGALLRAWSEGWLAEHMADYDIRSELGRIEHPVLVAQGERDEYATDGQAITTAAAIGSNAELLIEPGAKHLWHHDDPSRFVDVVVDFVARTVDG
ncbi:MAG: alpha/beta fold hydrolase [Actinomycetota bacterium]